MAKEFERWRRGDRDGRERNLSNDIYDLARQYGIDDKGVAASLYSEAYQLHPHYDPGAVWRRYEHLLRQWSTPRPAPGKQTRTAAIYGSSTPWEVRQPGVAPGKRTRTMALAEAIDKRERYFADREPAAGARQSGKARSKAERFPVTTRSWPSCASWAMPAGCQRSAASEPAPMRVSVVPKGT